MTSIPYAVNESGTVAGVISYLDTDNKYKSDAFVGGKSFGPIKSPNVISEAKAINSFGQAVGIDEGPIYFDDTHPWIFDGTSAHYLDWKVGSEAIGISDAGTILGRYGSTGFTVTNGTRTYLTDEGAGNTPYAMNASGMIIGTLSHYDGSYYRSYPAMWRDGAYQIISGSDRFLFSFGQKIAANGTCGGYGYKPDNGRVFPYTYINGVLTEYNMNTHDHPRTIGISDDGTMVMYTDNENTFQLDYYSLLKDGKTYDIRDLVDVPDGFVIGTVDSMNSRGQIAGTLYSWRTGESKMFIATAVPEPSGLIALGAGLLITLRRRLRIN